MDSTRIMISRKKMAGIVMRTNGSYCSGIWSKRFWMYSEKDLCLGRTAMKSLVSG